jgi:hypothetical protein
MGTDTGSVCLVLDFDIKGDIIMLDQDIYECEVPSYRQKYMVIQRPYHISLKYGINLALRLQIDTGFGYRYRYAVWSYGQKYKVYVIRPHLIAQKCIAYVEGEVTGMRMPGTMVRSGKRRTKRRLVVEICSHRMQCSVVRIVAFWSLFFGCLIRLKYSIVRSIMSTRTTLDGTTMTGRKISPGLNRTISSRHSDCFAINL